MLLRTDRTCYQRNSRCRLQFRESTSERFAVVSNFEIRRPNAQERTKPVHEHALVVSASILTAGRLYHGLDRRRSLHVDCKNTNGVARITIPV